MQKYEKKSINVIFLWRKLKKGGKNAILVGKIQKTTLE